MAVDMQWVESVRALPDIAERDGLAIAGVDLALPLSKVRGIKLQHRAWQRRVVEDMVPESVVGDASEKILVSIVNALTTGAKDVPSFESALGEDFGPLRALFAHRTQGKHELPLPFHAVVARSARKVDSRSFSEKTLLLLATGADGQVDVALLARFINALRPPQEVLNLAQRTVLERLAPGWTTAQAPQFNLDLSEQGPTPFVERAGSLFRQDLANLLDARLENADFFAYASLLLVVHFGLYLPRLAYQLNPSMDMLLAELAVPGSRTPADLAAVERDVHNGFAGSLCCRAPDPGGNRPVQRHAEVRRSFALLERELGQLHFNLLLLNRLRDLARSYLHRWRPEAAGRLMLPSTLVGLMQQDPASRVFICRAAEALCVRFVAQQLPESQHAWAWETLADSPSGLHALRNYYEKFNSISNANARSTRAYSNGMSVVVSLLRRGNSGLVQSRKGLGYFFELGVGALPYFLVVSMGRRKKMRLSEFWERLAAYGLRFDPEERALLLGRLKVMGLYERFSDAGEASYVRNLVAMANEGAR